MDNIITNSKDKNLVYSAMVIYPGKTLIPKGEFHTTDLTSIAGNIQSL